MDLLQDRLEKAKPASDLPAASPPGLSSGIPSELTSESPSGRSRRARVNLEGLDSLPSGWRARILSGPVHTAYVKVAEGCDESCSFCLIPRLRGPQRSRPLEEILEEVEHLVARGVREIILVAQDTTAYGFDRTGRSQLADLLRCLNEVRRLAWIRILYTHPRNWTDDLLEAVRDLPRVCKYIDIPIQHTSERLLQLMRRGISWAGTRRWLERFRAEIPGVVLRTTVLAGFPGETEQEHEALCCALREFPFDRLGTFAYSPEQGTDAVAFCEAINEEERLRRRAAIMAQQRDIALRLNRRFLGTVRRVIVDDVWHSRGLLVARSEGEAPEVDGVVYVRWKQSCQADVGQRRVGREAAIQSRADREAGDRPQVGRALRSRPGDMLEVRLTGAGPYDFIAEPVI